MEKITLEKVRKLNPGLNPKLFMPDPKTTWKRMKESPIKDWLEFISNEYTIKRVENLILIPCSFYKPYDPPRDEFYRRIHELRKKLRNTKFITVSVPLALEPEEYWNFQWEGHNLIYDCPFFPWIEKFGYHWDQEIANRVLSRLREVIDNFFDRNKGRYQRVLAFFVPSSDEFNLVRKHADYVVPKEEPKIEVSYDNNTSEIYCHPKVWAEFLHALKNLGE